MMQSYQTLDERFATLALWYITNTSLVAFYKLIGQFKSAKEALCQNVVQWQSLGIHVAHIKRWQDNADVMAILDRINDECERGLYHLLFLQDEHYPKMLQEIYDPPPILFCRGQVERLSDEQIAIVGSRHPTDFAGKITFDMAQYLTYHNLTITSGLAGGVDKSAHLGALSGGMGQTVGVLGTGIDVCYPKNHNALYAQIIHDGGCLVSELLPSTPASKHTFPRRNRLVAGLSLATVVTEAAMQSGSLITARLATEQGKQVFAVPSSIDNANAEGCHHLIREGATLIYHPSQIIDELREYVLGYTVLPKPFSHELSAYKECNDGKPKNNETYATSDKHYPDDIPEHLQDLWDKLTHQMVDLDMLMTATHLEAGQLLAGLTELEILGLVQAVGGRYARV